MAVRLTSVLLGVVALHCTLPCAAELYRVVDQNGKPVADAAVHFDDRQPATGSDLHTIAQIDKEFVPRFSLIRAGTVVDFPNQDRSRHHVYSFSSAKSFELELYHGETSEPVRFPDAGIVTLGCNVHDWMIGWIYVVSGTPVGLTDERGYIEIPAIDAPESLSIWHPHALAPMTVLMQPDSANRTLSLNMQETVLLPERPATTHTRRRRSVRSE
ncbi:MAG: methylamine utilization protein [Pseudomonadota bacterium]